MGNDKMQATKKSPATARKGQEARKGYDARKMGNFIGDVKAELKRVSWTSKEELGVYTKIVVGATFALGVGLYVTDVVMHKLVSGLGVLFHLVFG